jgi:hypothetical protein
VLLSLEAGIPRERGRASLALRHRAEWHAHCAEEGIPYSEAGLLQGTGQILSSLHNLTRPVGAPAPAAVLRSQRAGRTSRRHTRRTFIRAKSRGYGGVGVRCGGVGTRALRGYADFDGAGGGGLVVATRLTRATGLAEREAARLRAPHESRSSWSGGAARRGARGNRSPLGGSRSSTCPS